ncbi:Tyrosine--tRNA ligase [Aphelenchoides bicaudatus]|nr:Tyrosine--tRNA ligase [Aphelenchoides bicaudatus]
MAAAQEFELSEEQSERLELITRNLQEVLGEQQIRKHLHNNKNIHIYWGTATTGRPHVGYFVPMQKISDFLRAGIKITILFADLHGFLDNLKSTFELLENRVLYYEHIIKATLRAFDVPLDKLSFRKGSTYQLTGEYTQDILRLCGQVSMRDALKAGAEVVKQTEDPLLSGLMYPLLQTLDEQYLKVDGQFGGVDQRKIFILAEEQLPKLKLGKRYHLMNYMVPGLIGSKMSSSEENTKIDLLDSPEVVERKVQSANCSKTGEDGVDSGVLAFFKHVVFPIRGSVKVGDVEFSAPADLISAFNEDKVTEDQLKTSLAQFLNNILGKIQSDSESAEVKEILAKAYAAEALDNVPVPEESVPELDADGKKLLESLSGGLELIESPHLVQRIHSKQPIRVVWRFSAKGRFHLGYLKPLLELRRLKQLGCQCSIVLSDLGGFLDDEKCPWNARGSRLTYYDTTLKEVLKVLDLADIPIKHTTESEFTSEYTINMYKSLLVLWLAIFARSITFLDVHYADADLQLIGEHQKNFVELGARLSERCHLPKQAALIHKTLNGMNGQRMSSTQADFQLNPADTPKQTKTKIAKSFCEPGNLNNNIAIQLARDLVFPLNDFKPQLIERSEENGGNLQVKTADELDQLFIKEQLHPGDLKAFVVKQLQGNSYLDYDFFNPISTAMDAATLSKLLKAAFPPAPKGGQKK